MGVKVSVHANFALQNAPHHADACLRHDARRISAEVLSHLVSEVVARFQRVAGNFSVNLGGGGTADD